jgi:hypothetical protein
LAHNDGLRYQAAAALTIVDREYLPVGSQRLLLLGNLIVVLKNLEIGHGDVGNQFQVPRAPIRFRRMKFGFLCLHALLDLAPDVDVPVDLGPQHVLLLERHACALLEVTASACVQGREGARLRLADLGARHLNTCGKDLDVEIACYRFRNQSVQIRVLEGFPPVGLDGGGGGYGHAPVRPRILRRRIGALIGGHADVDATA